MLCEQCQNNEAVVHIQALMPDGSSVSRALCPQCAAKLRPPFGAGIHVQQLTDFITSLMGRMREGRAEKEQDRFDATCPECGQTYAEYKKSGMLGCVECYRAFREPLEEMLVKRNGAAIYAGVSPDGAELNGDIHRVRKLREEMQSAIEQENFEDAARIRDELRHLEGRLTAHKEEA